MRHKSKTYPFLALAPEPLEAMQGRFSAAIAEPFHSGKDPRILDPKYRFDFEDGTRLIVTRDRFDDDREVIMVIAISIPPSPPVPLTLAIARFARHFAEIAAGAHGDGAVLSAEHDHAVLIYPLEKRVCRVCGCSELRACEGGCYWVGPNLCSQCARGGGDG